jgi:hypothetical protein
MKLISSLAVFVVGFSTAQVSATPVTIQNYSFESPTLGGPGSYTGSGFTDGFTFVEGSGTQWATSNEFTLDGSGNLLSPADGHNFAYMNGSNTALIYQDVGALLPNATYTLTVAAGSRIDQGPSGLILGFANSSTYAIGDSSLLAESASLRPAITVGGFTDVSFTFTTGSVVSGDLTIFIQNANDNYPSTLDNVRLDVVAVPEPATTGLAIGGGIFLLIVGRRIAARRTAA